MEGSDATPKDDRKPEGETTTSDLHATSVEESPLSTFTLHYSSIHNITRQRQPGMGIVEATTLKSDLFELEGASKDTVWEFIKAVTSLDYRGRKYLKLPEEPSESNSLASDISEGDIFDAVDETRNEASKQSQLMSAKDLTLFVLHSCDPFFRQEVLWKMSECRLAVPLLLPAFDDASKVQFQLWGLRKIYKSWNPLNATAPVEQSVVEYPIPIVSFLRYGEISISKSKLLNKVIGKLQGNSDHSYFVDSDEEPPCSKWSKGTVEVAWFLPESTGKKQDDNAKLRDAVTFLNLRGDANCCKKQKEFALLASDVVVLLVTEDNFRSNRNEIRDMKTTRHLVCVVSTENPQKHGKVLREGNVTVLFSKPFLEDIGSDICEEINLILWGEQSATDFRSIRSLAEICSKLQIDVDEDTEACVKGKKFSTDIVDNVRKCTEGYKKIHLPLQTTLWGKWAALDKKWTTGFDQKFPTVEHFRDELQRQMREIREQQLNTAPANDIVKFVETLKSPTESFRYFVSWLDFLLNDLSQQRLGPLRKQLRDIQKRTRDINTEKSKLKDETNISDESLSTLSALKEEDVKLILEAKAVAVSIDKDSLGIEHFIRELGQRYEAYEEIKSQNGTCFEQKINVAELPNIAAKLLISGYPLEILDGDVGRVPIKWVKAVFAVLEKELNNPKVCAVSVLGIQSSGKSTLLNCMFGVRFAVSAGRCTRGVFIQLLKVDEELRPEVKFDYLIVIDTEGLKAPERSLHDDYRHDNELATFALCLADVTIINIAGQTVGKDMTDVLQIAAHAFLRMKEVHITSSCRIIQQFVADLAAVEKNDACTQSILASLDEAVVAAAKDEGYCNLYTRFSDVFNLKSSENVQYFPSLWQGTMAPPNHRYSEKIAMLRQLVISDLQDASRTLSEFSKRTTDVWNAVKEENFIFSFQNCVTALRYKTFQHTYGTWVSDMRQVIMESESNAKQKLRNVSKALVEETKGVLLQEINRLVEEERSELEIKLLGYLRDNMEQDEDQLHKFQEEFLQDLDLTERNFKQDARDALNRVEDGIRQLYHMDDLLPACKNQLREMARNEALQLRGKHADSDILDQVAIETFEKLWEGWIRKICASHPTKKIDEEQVRREIYLYRHRIGKKRDLSKGPRRRTSHIFSRDATRNNHKVIVDKIIAESIETLIRDIENDFAFEPAIIKQLIDTTLTQLNSRFDGVTLSQEVKLTALDDLCNQAVPIIFQGRCKYNETYSLRELLQKEKENLWKDFKALYSSAFQDTRASETVTTLLHEKLVDRIRSYLGPAIFKIVRKDCPYFASKFAMFGALLEDMANTEDFMEYFNFLFELPIFLEDWALRKIAAVCVSEKQGYSFVERLVEEEVEVIGKKLLDGLISTVSAFKREEGYDCSYSEWIDTFRDSVNTNVSTIHISEEDVRNVLLFDVNNFDFFSEQIETYLTHQLVKDVKEALKIPHVGCEDEAKQMLRLLPTKPQAEVAKHVSGCTEQCPICHAPCDNMTAQHKKHRAELHFPEGVIGAACRSTNKLICHICTSSVTTNEVYWDGKVKRKYRDYKTSFPDWIIQPVQDESPVKYWKWVMNYFNEDFANLYGVREAELPKGWIEIRKEDAIQDLRHAYFLREV